VVFANLFYRDLGYNRSVCNLAALILGSSGIIWYHAEFGELQALLMLLIIISLFAFLKERPVFAAGMYASAMLTSQAAAPLGLCFLLFAYWKKSWPIFLRFSVAFSLMFVLGVAPIAEDYFFGPRGLFPSMGYYQNGPVSKMLLYFCYRLLENHTVWLVPLMVGVVSCLKQEKRLLLLTLAMWIPLAWLNLKLGHIEYGFAWMPFFFITSLLASLGAHAIWCRFYRSIWAGFWSSTVLVIVGSLLAYLLYVLPKSNDAKDLTRLVRETAAETREGTVIASPYVGFVYVYETAPETADVWKANWVMWPPVGREWEAIVRSHDPVFVLVSKPHTHVFRKWILGNLLAIVLRDSEQNPQYLMEGASETVEDARQNLPSEFFLRLVAEQGNTQLYRLQKVSDPSLS
jgi:hypothetical protein